MTEDRDFGDIFDTLEVEDLFLQTEHSAALVELTEQISLIEAEIQHLKDDSISPCWDQTLFQSGTHFAFGSGLYSSSLEEGRMAMSGGQCAKKKITKNNC